MHFSILHPRNVPQSQFLDSMAEISLVNKGWRSGVAKSFVYASESSGTRWSEKYRFLPLLPVGEARQREDGVRTTSDLRFHNGYRPCACNRYCECRKPSTIRPTSAYAGTFERSTQYHLTPK